MRTTIELKPENRVKLLELAARRGEKGFSNLVNEAIERYVPDDELERRKRLAAAFDALPGTLTKKEAEQMKANIRKWRKSWRTSS